MVKPAELGLCCNCNMPGDRAQLQGTQKVDATGGAAELVSCDYVLRLPNHITL